LRFCILIFITFQVGLAISYGLWAVASNFFIFIIARIIGGVSKGNISLAVAIIADVLPVESRGFGMVSDFVSFIERKMLQNYYSHHKKVKKKGSGDF